MTQSTLLFAYEINALAAKTLLQKRTGFAAKFKKFKAAEIVDHVTACWDELENLFISKNINLADKIFYTVNLQDPLRIGKTRNDIVNNSLMMSVISDDSRFGREAIESARFYQYTQNSDFEKNQFSILLEELSDQYSSQEVGIFGWISVPADSIDTLVKQVSVKFSKENDGELHFIEITDKGEIFPNFANVSTQKFEGKLAGNYSLILSVSDYESGIERLNSITQRVVRKQVFNISPSKIPNERGSEEMSDQTGGKKSYSDEFKIEVAKATQVEGSTLASVGEQFDVSPTLVRNWKLKFLDEQEQATEKEDLRQIATKDIQKWLQAAEISGSVDTDGDLSVNLETSDNEITDRPIKLFLLGTQKLASGSKSENSEFETELSTNANNWIRSEYLRNIDKSDPTFALNFNLDCYQSGPSRIIPVKIEKGEVPGLPISSGNLTLSKLAIIYEDDDFRAEGVITGPNGFVYGFETHMEEPESDHLPMASRVSEDEGEVEVYEFLWDVSEGDTVYFNLTSFTKLQGKISTGYSGTAEVEKEIDYDESEFDVDERPDIEDTETSDGDIGLFEFQIKRGLIDEDQIEEDEIHELVDELKTLCVDGKNEEAAKLLLPQLSFEFAPDQLDDDPEQYFSDLDYIEFECDASNTSVKVGSDGDLVVTIAVQFEIPLKGGISTQDLSEYLPDSGAWAAASVSPGWGYAGSDGDNVWFLGIKGTD